MIPALAEHFTVYNYARRGRGASGFTEPYAVEREIEDLDALIAEAGGSAHLFGASSGGALALEAAAAGSAIDTIAVWEVPYAVGDDIRPRFEEYVATPGRLRRRARRVPRTVHAHDRRLRRQHRGQESGRQADGALGGFGRPRAHAGPRQPLPQPLPVARPIDWQRSPNRSWSPPEDRSRSPTAGLPSDFFDRAADELADLLPHAQRETEMDHVVDPQIVGPLLLRFFSSEHRGPARCCGKTD